MKTYYFERAFIKITSDCISQFRVSAPSIATLIAVISSLLLFTASGSASAQNSPLVSVVQIDEIEAPIERGPRINARISADGRFIALEGTSNLRIYRHDRVSGDTRVVSVSSAGVEAEQGSGQALEDMSADGRFVVFQSNAANLVPNDTSGFNDLFAHDAISGETRRINVSSAGVEANGDDGGSNEMRISDDGRFVAYVSIATNLVPLDTNGTEDVFVYDTQVGENTRVSINDNGFQGNGQAHGPSISGDGQIVAFATEARNLGGAVAIFDVPLYVHDRTSGETTLISRKSGLIAASTAGPEVPAISSNGRFIGFQSTDIIDGTPNRGDPNFSELYVFDRSSETAVQINLASDGTFSDDGCGGKRFFLSANGRYAVYECKATNLIDGDTNGLKDVFVFDRVTGLNTRVNVALDGSELTDHRTNILDITPDAKYLLVQTSIRNYSPGEASDNEALFVLELAHEPDSAPAPAGEMPIAMPDQANTDVDTIVTINVLANDQGLADGPIVVSITTDPTNGSAIVLADNRVSYTPASGFIGNDNFQYTVADSDGDSSSASVTITVTDPNAGGGGSGALPAAVDDTGTVETGFDIVIDVLANDQNLDDAPIVVTISSGPANGSATVLADNRIAYTPAGGFIGDDSFQYFVTDNDGDSSIATVTITVTDPNGGGGGGSASQPAAMNDAGNTVSGGNIVINVLANDQNLVDAPFVVTIPGGPANGSTFVLDDNRISYTAASDFVGVDSFDYKVTDNDGDSSSGTITITVTAQSTGGNVIIQGNAAPSGGAFGPVALIFMLSLLARNRYRRRR